MLTQKQQRFVEEYVVDLNATAAVIRAGYSKRGANVRGSMLLANVSIKAEIDALLGARSKRTNTTADKVLRELKILAHSDIGDIIDFSGDSPRMKLAKDIPAKARRAISAVKVKRYVEGKNEEAKTVEIIEFKLWSKPDGLDKLMKHLGMFKDRDPLEVLLAALPPAIAGAIRAELAKQLSSGGAFAGGGDGLPTGEPPPQRPDNPDAGDGLDP